MKRLSQGIPVLALAALLFAACAPAQAQPILVGPPVVYAPPVIPVRTAYYYSAPVTGYYGQPVTTFYAPPVTTYYAPPVATYYAPAPVSVYTYRYGLFGRRVGVGVTIP